MHLCGEGNLSNTKEVHRAVSALEINEQVNRAYCFDTDKGKREDSQ